MAKRLLGNAGKRCRPCHACGCSAPRTASSELAPADAAAADEAPPSEPARQAAEALRNPLEADDVILDMQRYYDKHQIPSLAPYGEIALRRAGGPVRLPDLPQLGNPWSSMRTT